MITICAGWFSTHSVRRSRGYETYDSLPCFCSERIMAVSTAPSHCSTLPLAFKFLPKPTRSPSGEHMAKMSTDLGSDPKSRLLIPSKHLDMCGCTACTFFVCARISSSSSLDRK